MTKRSSKAVTVFFKIKETTSQSSLKNCQRKMHKGVLSSQRRSTIDTCIRFIFPSSFFFNRECTGKMTFLIYSLSALLYLFFSFQGTFCKNSCLTKTVSNHITLTYPHVMFPCFGVLMAYEMTKIKLCRFL